MGKTSNVMWNGCRTYTINGREFECEFKAYGTYYYDAGCMYLRNGDPGYPPEEECEVAEIELLSIVEYEPDTDTDGVDVTTTLDAETCEQIEELITEDCYDGEERLEFPVQIVSCAYAGNSGSGCCVCLNQQIRNTVTYNGVSHGDQ